MERDHDPANNDGHKQKDHEQTEPQTKLFADNRKNEVCVRVREIKHLLATITQAKPFHSTTAPGDECLHLLQAGIFFEILRMEKAGESAHSFRHLGRNNENSAE